MTLPLPSRLARVLVASLLLAGGAQAAAQQGEVLGRLVLQHTVQMGGGDVGASGTTAPATWGLAELVGYAGVVEGSVGDGNGPALAGGATLLGAQRPPAGYAPPLRSAPWAVEAPHPPLRHLYCVYRL